MVKGWGEMIAKEFKRAVTSQFYFTPIQRTQITEALRVDRISIPAFFDSSFRSLFVSGSSFRPVGYIGFLSYIVPILAHEFFSSDPKSMNALVSLATLALISTSCVGYFAAG
ncbi:hypothetical protein BX661DRAFT_80849 [Kickxella alabastrina]|uniref:uncharacterized protein n=1 Tax=Kickxella alabastrina TaxID=61397 RepID=UPI002220D03A|nr:uncharacterized protein BX661DRAFT_80849 [Kickxella alabastrina]KAI7832979.1 hypothetical protein BX661DRAFT_80849 [Kickxella alabastrina]